MDWFSAGEAVFKGGVLDDSYFPKLDDQDAQRQWLAGFGAAWVECPDGVANDSILSGDCLGGESVEEALMRALEMRPELLGQLWAHGLGKVARVMH